MKDPSGHKQSAQFESLNHDKSTPIVSTSDGPKSLLSSSIPDLKFTHFACNLVHFEPEIDSDGGQIVINKVVIAVSNEEWRFADTLIAYDDDFEEKILLFDHNIIIEYRLDGNYLQVLLFNLRDVLLGYG